MPREVAEGYLYGMKMTLYAALLTCFVVGSTGAQESGTNFSFNWESGEISMDMHLEDSTWILNGKALTYSRSVAGRDSGMPKAKSPFRPTTVLNEKQLSKLKILLGGLLNERSVSLLPKGYQGTLLRYSLSSGMPEKEIDFEAPQMDVNRMNAANPQGTAPSPGTPPAGKLLYKFDELRDYLVLASSQ